MQMDINELMNAYVNNRSSSTIVLATILKLLIGDGTREARGACAPLSYYCHSIEMLFISIQM